MMNLVLNPNLNSTWLFRADVLYDSDSVKDDDGEGNQNGHADSTPTIITHDVHGMNRYRTLSSLIIYFPHASHQDIPYYHPKVRGIAHLHQWNPSTQTGTISIHFLPFPDLGQDTPEEALKLSRTAYHLLETINKHGHAQNYVKRVHHDVVVPRRRFQDRYALLKSKYARSLVETWAEKTDPTKHVFEDLGIAAFLIELWAGMYPSFDPDSITPTSGGQGGEFPGFVDMACGNGLLVYILNQEGFPGWGFDVRRRKSWAQYSVGPPPPPSPSSARASAPSPPPLQERLLLPDFILSSFSPDQQQQILSAGPDRALSLHGGSFPKGTFIISNHGDELTPWTPILAGLSQCPFIVIPCCSHNFAGERFRAPPPRDKSKPKSAYASLVDWVAHVAEDCGWDVETEMLRIPSTRNTCMLGRRRGGTACRVENNGSGNGEMDEAMAMAVVEKYGGVKGYFEAVSKLVKSEARGH
ncbi:tRNA (uracil-O(2)-)-methyltransferase [Escovopsis weberi]|uniref:tRNA (uracil-O(2)-)-methyltransferase n=1 Tax=Escovopsis weberi TaxID=150374 RepID=A0A0M8N2K9_ESCWE|nr:tRNA (uracil-O(2)-)-methyltransferase [Escovopsis weberi]